MKDSESKTTDSFTWLGLIAAIMAVALQIYPPQSQADKLLSAVFFMGILLFVLLLYGAGFIYRKIDLYTTQINKNSDGLERLEVLLDTQRKSMEIEKRISIMEHMLLNRKGKSNFSDPRWIIVLVLMVLFYFYLRALGFIR